MRWFLTDPRTGKPSEMVTLSVLATLAAVFRFLFDGITIEIYAHKITFNHVDAMVYLAFLSPILGAHSFLHRGKDKNDSTSKK
jgi:hypothetical protein